MVTPEPRNGKAARQQARRRGVRAETVAALWLRLKCYRIVARSFTIRGGEIDIIARRGRTLAFVEVKYRPESSRAAEAITAAKRRRLGLAARAWLSAHPKDADLEARFDAVLISPGHVPRHIEGAWDDAGRD